MLVDPPLFVFRCCLVPCVAGSIGVGAGSGVRAADTSAHDLSGADADAWGGDELDLGFDSE